MKKQLRTLDSNDLASVHGGIGIKRAINLLEAIRESELGPAMKRYLRQEVKAAIDLSPRMPPGTDA